MPLFWPIKWLQNQKEEKKEKKDAFGVSFEQCFVHEMLGEYQRKGNILNIPFLMFHLIGLISLL